MTLGRNRWSEKQDVMIRMVHSLVTVMESSFGHVKVLKFWAWDHHQLKQCLWSMGVVAAHTPKNKFLKTGESSLTNRGYLRCS